MPLPNAFLSHGAGWWVGWFVGGRAVDRHPRKWCCHVYQTRYPSVSISVGYGHTCSHLHPRNSLHRRGVCCRVFKLVRLCLYLHLCCINYSLEVLRGQRVSVFACHALDSFDAITQCVYHFDGVCDGGIGDVFVLELHGVGQRVALGVFYKQLCVQ
jgi:hypothetical protein